MATTLQPAALVPTAPVFTQAERLALTGFLAGYSGLTREALRAGPAPVRILVPAAPPAPVPGPSRRHRAFRP
jgi:hypothetical protein